MKTEQAKLHKFKEWFDDMWLGDNDHSQFVPLPNDKGYSEYIDKYQISYAAWITAAKLTEENKYQTLIDQIAEIKSLQEELETLRASNTIKQANIELLREENVRLKTELLCMEHDRDALLADVLTPVYDQAKIELAQNITCREYSLPMQMFYASEDDSRWLCVKEYQDIEPQRIEIGYRVIMPIWVFEDYHIVKTWLVDPTGSVMTAKKTKLLKTKYLKTLIKAADRRSNMLKK